jgi:hypothetical protein
MSLKEHPSSSEGNASGSGDILKLRQVCCQYAPSSIFPPQRLSPPLPPPPTPYPSCTLQILEHQASVLVNQINSINEAPPPAASQDIIDAGLIVGEATSTMSAMHAATQASLTQARASLDEKRQHIEKVTSHAPPSTVDRYFSLFSTSSFLTTHLAGAPGLLPVRDSGRARIQAPRDGRGKIKQLRGRVRLSQEDARQCHGFSIARRSAG